MTASISLESPLSADAVAGLRVGDHVSLTGVIYTARDAAHRRLVEMAARGERLALDLRGQVIYYVGPTPPRPGCVIGAAGWFTFPDHSVTYPWGILLDSTLTGSSFDPDRFLRVPTAVFVGERDRNPQALALNKSDRVRLQQGESRFKHKHH